MLTIEDNYCMVVCAQRRDVLVTLFKAITIFFMLPCYLAAVLVKITGFN